MQARTASPREGLTGAQVDAIATAGDLSVSAGLDVVDSDGNVTEDVTADLLGGQVEHDSRRRIPRLVTLQLTRRLDWGGVRVRPRMTLSSQGLSATFWLGVFVLDTPAADVQSSPNVFEVGGFDLTKVLDDPYGSTYSVAAGSDVLDTVTTLVEARGLTVSLDQDAAGVTTSTAWTWPLDQRNTTLKIVNDLLASVGYRPAWCDFRGRIRGVKYVPPSQSPSEFTYSTDVVSGTIVDRISSTNLLDAPNRWVFVNDNPDLGLPSEGSGIYTVTNQSDGGSSIDARGRTITKVVRLDAESTAALEAQGDAIVDADRTQTRLVEMMVDPQPRHEHFDTVTINDPQVSQGVRFEVDGWRLPLDGSPMMVAARRSVA